MTANWDRSEYYSRGQGLVSEAVNECRVLAVGCGAGSYLLEKLARTGPALLTLVDPESVDLHNLSRTTYTLDDVGQPKVNALARRIEQINPFVQVQARCADICALSEEDLQATTADTDLIIAGTDYFPAQALLNRLSQVTSVPAVFIGIHAGARGGRIIWSVPGESSCYRCVAHERYEQFEEQGSNATDLPAMHGLLVDCQFIDMVALKVCLALLERNQTSALGRFYTAMAGRNEIIVRTSPAYEYGKLLWQAVLGDLPKHPKPYARELEEQVLFAMDTIWLSTDRRLDCPDCSTPRPGSEFGG